MSHQKFSCYTLYRLPLCKQNLDCIRRYVSLVDILMEHILHICFSYTCLHQSFRQRCIRCCKLLYYLQSQQSFPLAFAILYMLHHLACCLSVKRANIGLFLSYRYRNLKRVSQVNIWDAFLFCSHKPLLISNI